MSAQSPPRRIAIAADMRAGSEQLFAHGIKLALAARAELHVVHSHLHGEDPGWDALPSTRRLLSNWGALHADASKEDYAQLGMSVHAHSVEAPEPIAAVLGVMQAVEPDLLLLGTEGRKGVERVLMGSVGERIARGVRRPTLFIGHGVRGILDLITGAPRISRVLMPIGGDLELQPAVDAVAGLLALLGVDRVEIIVTHLGGANPGGANLGGANRGDAPLPPLTLPVLPGWDWRLDVRDGSVVGGIIEAARAHTPDLIAMGTHARSSPVRALRSSNTEQVLHRVRCPVLAVPIGD